LAGQISTGRKSRKKINANKPIGLEMKMFQAHNRMPETLIYILKIIKLLNSTNQKDLF